MSPVPWLYRNVINPWQTPREIRLAVRSIEKMVKARGFDDEQVRAMVSVGMERVW